MKIRFITEEEGILYMITNWRNVNGKIVYSLGKCWKFPLKKKRATNQLQHVKISKSGALPPFPFNIFT